MIIYKLTITDLELSYKNHNENFDIGYFTTYEKAAETAQKYLTEVEGFKNYPCEYRITEKPIADLKACLASPTNIFSANFVDFCTHQDTKQTQKNQISFDTVYIINGWNINDNFDETDIIESDCFVTYESSLQELNNMKQKYHRTEWCIDKYKLDECNWIDGFTRV